MSRRATPGQAAQNQQTIKALLKLDANKVCADCKRNKHPRWASWNLGIFVCIRCSGIHRGMGTHISRVKSVDLDAWTDEQLQSVLKWGNGRANRYWEAKLAPGHVPSEAKLENFIRTKYEAKRWVMDGPIPDPSTLNDGDDDVPLAVVQENVKIERSASQRHPVAPPRQPAHRPQASIDLFADDNDMISAPPRPNTTEPIPRAPPRQAQPAPQKTHKPADSLLGLDFFGSAQPSAGSRPASTASTPAAPAGLSRPDLKQSILSLYAKPQAAPAPIQHARQNSFGDMTTPTAPSMSSNMGGLTDAFSGLSFPSTTSPPPQAKPSPFSNLANFSTVKSSPAAPKITSPSGSASGDLFDSLTSPTGGFSSPKTQSRAASISSNSQDFGFSGFSYPTKPAKPNPPSSSLSNDLFGLSSPPSAPPKPSVASPQQEMSSAFNLSTPSFQPPAIPKPQVPAMATSPGTTVSNIMTGNNMDPWGGNAWNTPDPTPAPAQAMPASSTSSMMKIPDTLTANDIGGGWGMPPKETPAVAADEDFGGWTSAAPVSSGPTTTSSSNKTGGFGGSDDLFSNVWE